MVALEQTDLNLKNKTEQPDCEFDILALNTTELVVVEVKTTLKVEDVQDFLPKLERFTEWMPYYKGLRILGAVAYLREEQSAMTYAERQGLFVIRATGSSACIQHHQSQGISSQRIFLTACMSAALCGSKNV